MTARRKFPLVEAVEALTENGYKVLTADEWAEVERLKGELAERDEALREAKQFYDEHYPQIAGHIIGLQTLGETVAEASWLETANALHSLGQSLKAALSARAPQRKPR